MSDEIKLKKKIDKDDLVNYYANHTLSATANHFNLSTKTLKKNLASYNIPLHDRKTDIMLGCREKYGVDNNFKSEQIKQKIKETKLQRYGDANYNNRELAQKTCLSKYGTDYASEWFC